MSSISRPFTRPSKNRHLCLAAPYWLTAELLHWSFCDVFCNVSLCLMNLSGDFTRQQSLLSPSAHNTLMPKALLHWTTLTRPNKHTCHHLSTAPKLHQPSTGKLGQLVQSCAVFVIGQFLQSLLGKSGFCQRSVFTIRQRPR